MARWYEFRFSTPKGYAIVRGQGNTKRSAERSARWRLRDEGYDPKECDRVGRIESIPAHLHPVSEYSITKDQIERVLKHFRTMKGRSNAIRRAIIMDCELALDGSQVGRDVVAREFNKLNGWED